MFLLFIANLVGHLFLSEEGNKHPISCTVECIENGIPASVVVWFLMYLVEKQAVKAKKSSKVSTWAKKPLSDDLSARCVYIHYWSAFFLLVAYMLLVTVSS